MALKPYSLPVISCSVGDGGYASIASPNAHFVVSAILKFQIKYRYDKQYTIYEIAQYDCDFPIEINYVR